MSAEESAESVPTPSSRWHRIVMPRTRLRATALLDRGCCLPRWRAAGANADRIAPTRGPRPSRSCRGLPQSPLPRSGTSSWALARVRRGGIGSAPLEAAARAGPPRSESRATEVPAAAGCRIDTNSSLKTGRSKPRPGPSVGTRKIPPARALPRCWTRVASSVPTPLLNGQGVERCDLARTARGAVRSRLWGDTQHGTFPSTTGRAVGVAVRGGLHDDSQRIRVSRMGVVSLTGRAAVVVRPSAITAPARPGVRR